MRKSTSESGAMSSGQREPSPIIVCEAPAACHKDMTYLHTQHERELLLSGGATCRFVEKRRPGRTATPSSRRRDDGVEVMIEPRWRRAAKI